MTADSHSKNTPLLKMWLVEVAEKQESAEELDGTFLVCGEEGCQPKGSKVLMANGEFKNIEDVNLYDEVLSPQINGTYIYSKVIKLHKFYSEKNYNVMTLNRGNKKLYSCSYNHLIPINRVTTNRIKDEPYLRKRKWKLQIKSAIILHQATKTYLKNTTTPLAYPINSFKYRENPKIDPYTLGVLLGDGSICNKSINITSNDPEIISEITKKYKLIGISDKKKTTCKMYRFSRNSPLVEELTQLGLIGTRSGNKFIPDVVKYADIEYRKKVLAGIIDTDGYYSKTKNSYCITTKSEKLAKDISFVAYTLGYRNTIIKTTKTINKLNFKGTYYNVNIYVDYINKLPIILKHKQHNGNQFYKSSNRLSIKLEETKPSEVYGFTLDSPTGLYITDNFCITHNSGKSNTILTIAGLWSELMEKEIHITSITRNLKELFIELKKTQKGLVALDEGYELKSTNNYDKMVKKIERAFMLSRYKANLSLIAYTNPFKMNSYFRDDRAKGIFFCYKRKTIAFFTREDFKTIREHVKRRLGDIKSINSIFETPELRKFATFIEWNIPKYEGQLAKEYKQRKIQNVEEEMMRMEDELEEQEKTYTLSKAGKLLGMSRQVLSRYIKSEDNPEGIIEVEWNLAHTHAIIKESELLKFKERYVAGLTGLTK